MTINERFEKIIKSLYSNNKSLFAKVIGVRPSVIENVVGLRQGNPSFEVLCKIIYANADISAEWLLTGKGNMLHSENSSVKVLDQESIGFILDRYEALVRENVKLKEEIIAIKSGERHSSNLVSPAYIEKEIKSMFAAEPEQEKLKK